MENVVSMPETIRFFTKVIVLWVVSVSLVCSGGDLTDAKIAQMLKLCDKVRGDQNYLTKWNVDPKAAKPEQRKMRPLDEEIDWIVIHATTSQVRGPETDESKIVSYLDALESGAKEENGSYDMALEWGSIPYHILISPNGKVYQGRDFKMWPASGSSYAKPDYYRLKKTHASNGQLRSVFAPPKADRPGHAGGIITVAFIGSFMTEEQTRKSFPSIKPEEKIEPYSPSPRAVESMARVLGSLLSILDLKEESVISHREAANTSCPGDLAYKVVGPGIEGLNSTERVSFIGKVRWYKDRYRAK